MNVSVMQENLARGLGVVSRAVSSRATLPVLANVLLKTEDARAEADRHQPGDRDQLLGAGQGRPTEGEITVPAKLLTDLVSVAAEPADRPRALRQGPHPEGHLRRQPLAASRGSRPTSSRWWPPSVTHRPPAPTPGSLREALGEVVFAAASDESRPILTGVLTRLAGDTMTLAAADNYRIAVRSLHARQAGVSPEMSDRRAGPLVRRADADPARRRGPDRDHGHARTRARSSSTSRGSTWSSRLIEGQFPNYEPVIPTSHTSRAVIDREAFLAGARRASIFARDSANIVKIEVGGEDGDGRRRSRPTPPTSATTPTPLEASDRGIRPTTHRLQRPLPDRRARATSAPNEAALELSGPLAPGVIRGVGKDDYVHVIMPVRTAS